MFKIFWTYGSLYQYRKKNISNIVAETVSQINGEESSKATVNMQRKR